MDSKLAKLRNMYIDITNPKSRITISISKKAIAKITGGSGRTNVEMKNGTIWNAVEKAEELNILLEGV